MAVPSSVDPVPLPYLWPHRPLSTLPMRTRSSHGRLRAAVALGAVLHHAAAPRPWEGSSGLLTWLPSFWGRWDRSHSCFFHQCLSEPVHTLSMGMMGSRQSCLALQLRTIGMHVLWRQKFFFFFFFNAYSTWYS